MALPTTFTSTLWAPTVGGGELGPWIHGGAVYCFAYNTTTTKVTMYKATDPTSSFSPQDTTNSGFSRSGFFDCHYDGTYIHVMQSAVNGNTYYGRYILSTDSWESEDNIVSGGSSSAYITTIYNPTDTPVEQWGAVTVRSDGDIIIVHPGENYSNMGGTTQVTVYSRIEGTTLTAATSIADSGGKNDNYQRATVIMGSSDQCHFGYQRDSDSDFYLRALDSSNNLRTQRTHAGTFTVVQKGVAYTRSSTEIIAFNPRNATTSYSLYFDHFTDDSSPTFTQEITKGTGFYNSQPIKPYSYDSLATNQDQYCAYIGSSDQDIYLTGDDGSAGSPWSDQNSSTAIRAATATHMSANIYTRGGNRVYAFIYNDSSTVTYDEFTLYAVSTATSKPFTRRPVRFLARNF